LSAEADFAQQSTVKEKPVEPTALGAMHTRAVLVPARDEGDEIAAIMLAHLLNRSHYKIDTIPPLAQGQMLREISNRCPEIVCISALPPLSIGPARTLYRKVKCQTPKARIVVGMWRLGLGETMPGLQGRLGLSESDKIVTSLAESAYQIHAFCDSLA
jgi:hypothetical protein